MCRKDALNHSGSQSLRPHAPHGWHSCVCSWALGGHRGLGLLLPPRCPLGSGSTVCRSRRPGVPDVHLDRAARWTAAALLASLLTGHPLLKLPGSDLSLGTSSCQPQPWELPGTLLWVATVIPWQDRQAEGRPILSFPTLPPAALPAWLCPTPAHAAHRGSRAGGCQQLRRMAGRRPERLQLVSGCFFVGKIRV